MPVTKLSFQPGINTQISATANEGGWVIGDKVRFRDGVPEKWAGWTSFVSTVAPPTPVAAVTWTEQNGVRHMAVANVPRNDLSRLTLFTESAISDITPTRATNVRSNPIATTSGSATAIVTDASHGAVAGDLVKISGTTGGTYDGAYIVQAPVTSSTYAIPIPTASSTGSVGGSTVSLAYQLNASDAAGLAFSGWGLGGWGGGSWGAPTVGTTPFSSRPLNWSLQPWGEYLLSVPRGGTLYEWRPSYTPTGPATTVTNATATSGPPLLIEGMLIGMPERHVILFGCSDRGSTANYNAMRVMFSDTEDYTNFLPTQTDAAGGIVLQGGSRLVGGLNTSQQTYLWSDLCLFSMRYIGAPLIYGFDRLGTGCGLAGPHAAVEYGGVVYWMGSANFFTTQGGTPAPMPCTIWDHVFRNRNSYAADATWCGVNAAANEVLWFYASAIASSPDRYAAFNFVNGTWACGALDRAVWLDASVYPYPLGLDSAGMVWIHEQGTDAGGKGLAASITSGFQDIGDGDQMTFIERIIPDFERQSGTVQMTMTVLGEPNGVPVIKGPYALTPTTRFVTARARGRQVAFTFSATDIGSDFRLGAVRIAISADGKRV